MKKWTKLQVSDDLIGHHVYSQLTAFEVCCCSVRYTSTFQYLISFYLQLLWDIEPELRADGEGIQLERSDPTQFT